MQSGSIGKQDNWARFMQLSNEARLRNQGLSNSAGKANPLRKPVVARSLPLATAGGAGIQRTGSLYNASRPQIASRILGGKFDAYA